MQLMPAKGIKMNEGEERGKAMICWRRNCHRRRLRGNGSGGGLNKKNKIISKLFK